MRDIEAGGEVHPEMVLNKEERGLHGQNGRTRTLK